MQGRGTEDHHDFSESDILQAEDRDGTHTSTVREEVHPVERAYERALSRMKDFKSILINSSLSNKIILYFVFLVCRHHST
jgi:hypothetical protein